MLKRWGVKTMAVLGFQFIKGRAWAIIIAAIALSFGGAYTLGYVKSSLNCSASNAKAAVKDERRYTDSVKDASETAMDSAIGKSSRDEFFRIEQREILERYDEGFENTCNPVFNADDLRVFNYGSKAKDAESVRP